VWRRDLHRSGDAPEPEPRRPRHAPPESAPSASFLAALEEQRRAHAAEAAAAGTGAGAAAPPSPPPPPPPPPSLPGHVYDAERKRFFKIRRDGDVSSAETLRRIEAARPVPAPVLPLLSPRWGPSLGLVPALLAREGGAAAACLRAAPVDPLARVRAHTAPVWTGLSGRITGASFSGHLAVTSLSVLVREGPICRRRPLPLVVAYSAGGETFLVLGGGPRRANPSLSLYHRRQMRDWPCTEPTAAAFQPLASDSHPSSYSRSALLATAHLGHADAESYLAIRRMTAATNIADLGPPVVTSLVTWEHLPLTKLGRAGPWSLAWMPDRMHIAVGCSSDHPTHLLRVHEGLGKNVPVASHQMHSDVFCICPCVPAGVETGGEGEGDWGPRDMGGGGPPPLLLGQRNGQISLWDAMRCNTTTLLRQQKQQRGGAASSVVALAAVGGPTSGLFVVADAGTQLQVRDWRAWDRGPVFEEGARGYANTPHRLGVAVSGGVGGEGASVAACCADGLVRVWSLEDGGRLRLAAAHAVPAGAAVDGGGAARPTRVAWSPAGPGEAALVMGGDGGSGEGKGAEGDEEEEGMDKERRRRAWAGGCFLVGGAGFGDLLAVPPPG
jgi:hypothetical protein